jgi:hypothetical protein
MLFAAFLGTAAPLGPRGEGASAPHSLGPAVVPAGFALVNLTANNTTVDLSMAFNLSVDVVNATTGAPDNDSNYTFVWTGLPAFVPGTPGSGCTDPNGDNNSSFLNCTAASTTALSISVTATNWTNSLSNSTPTALSITVNSLPAQTGFTVSSQSVAPTDHVKVAVNSTVWFNVTSSSGTGPLTYQFSGLPLGCSSTVASFSCQPNRVGIYNVSVTTVDAYGFTAGPMNVTVTVTGTTTTTSSGIGTTGWAIVIGILVIGGLVTLVLLLQARREEHAGRMGTEESPTEPPQETGGPPPMGGTPPPPTN